MPIPTSGTTKSIVWLLVPSSVKASYSKISDIPSEIIITWHSYNNNKHKTFFFRTNIGTLLRKISHHLVIQKTSRLKNQAKKKLSQLPRPLRRRKPRKRLKNKQRMRKLVKNHRRRSNRINRKKNMMKMKIQPNSRLTVE